MIILGKLCVHGKSGTPGDWLWKIKSQNGYTHTLWFSIHRTRPTEVDPSEFVYAPVAIFLGPICVKLSWISELKFWILKFI